MKRQLLIPDQPKSWEAGGERLERSGISNPETVTLRVVTRRHTGTEGS